MASRSDHIAGKAVPYELVRSRRRSLTLIVRPDSSVEVRCPLTMSRDRIEQFICAKARWIEQKRQELSRAVPVKARPDPWLKADGAVIRQRLKDMCDQHGLPVPARIVDRDLVSRWGSCSSRGTVSINRRCLQLPPDLMDYVICHELCHLVHLNHSRDFWRLMQRCLPDALDRRQQLKAYRLMPVHR